MPAIGQPVTLRTTSPQAPFGDNPISRQLIRNLNQRADCQPMQLDILPRRDVRKVARVLLRNLADRPQLVRGQQPVRQPDPHHEKFGGLAFAADPARGANAVALGVDAPPLEVQPRPLGRDRVPTLGGGVADLVPWPPTGS